MNISHEKETWDREVVQEFFNDKADVLNNMLNVILQAVATANEAEARTITACWELIVSKIDNEMKKKSNQVPREIIEDLLQAMISLKLDQRTGQC